MASSIRVGKILTDSVKSSNGSPAITSDAAGNLTIPNIQGTVSFEKTEIWSDATRPSPVEGIFGYNTDSGYLEIYKNGEWKNINDFAHDNFVTENLTLHLDPSNPASYPGTGSTWFDISGQGNDCTLQNGPTYRGYSFLFNGSNQNAIVPPVAVPSGSESTYEVWVLGETNKSSSSFESRDSSNVRTLNVHLTWSNSNIYWDSGGGSTYDRINKAVQNYSEYRGWHQWVFTKNTGTGQMKIYLDGDLWHSGTGKTITIAASTNARIGSYYNNSTYHQGNLGVHRLYSKELTAAEVKRNYNATKYLYVGGLG